MRRYIWIIVGALVVLVLLFGRAAATLYTDWLWFQDLGYSVIFSKIIWTRVGLGLVFAALFAVIVYFNIWLARKIAPAPTLRYRGIENDVREQVWTSVRRVFGLALLVGTLVIAFFVALWAEGQWDNWLRFTNATPFGVKDPMFGVDVGFYVFRLDFWTSLYGWLFFTLFAAGVAAALRHYANEGIDLLGNVPRFAPRVKAHLAVIVALLFFLKAAGYRLGMYSLVLSPAKLFYGAGYTDVHARLPGLWILLVAAIIAGLLVLINIYRRGIWLAAGALVGLLGLSIITGLVYPAALERFVVQPNEQEKQRPFMARAIKYTRAGFRIDAVASRPFEYVPDLTADEIARNRAAVQNLRLWDYKPLQRAYQQLQALQQYYDFHDVGIDRYIIDGTYRQVMLSARELSGPPPDAQTWVNQYLRYTHGYSYVMSPVNEVSSEGMPVFFASRIPTVTRGGLKLDVPQIYFGELTKDFVLVNTRRREFDYPVGATEHETTYAAASGPTVGSLPRRLAFAIRFGDINVLLSDALQPSSRVLFTRSIAERAQTLFPFLTFDADPYLVTLNGRLYWFHDAYTVTNRYPYSDGSYPFQDSQSGVNYVRNSVKLVTDAYTGKVQAFVFDQNDPIIRTYARAFPGVFKPASQMPPEFARHIRYPEDLFSLQATVYSRYHMTEPSAFYSGTDLWEMPTIPDEEGQGDRVIEPYYIITRLPNSSTDEFILIVPLVRPGKYNMVAWMAAKCDPADYSKLIAYEFPRDRLVFGPRQVMARADQDTRISGQLTLWGQFGSKVVRGRLLAIPIENSILYVEPLYLESTSTKIPEFKRVIVSLGDRLTMEQTLEEALTKVVGVAALPAVAQAVRPSAPVPGEVRPTAPVRPAPPPPSAPPEVRDLARRAAEEFNRAQEAQRKGDWAGYGRQLDALKKTLAEIEKRTGR